MTRRALELRKLGFIVCLILTAFILFLFILDGNQKLNEDKVIEKRVNDFILHMKVEGEEDGIKIHQSIQYVGEDTVKIFHQTPLVSVSISNSSHDYTGSLVHKVMQKGSIYHQDSVQIPVQHKGKDKLFVEAKFHVGEELVKIEHMEPLMFN